MLATALCALLLAQPPAGDPSPAAPAPAATTPAAPANERVGGDLEATVTLKDGVYTFGKSQITTPLPDGYPAPTPPGSIDIKVYPAARAAVVTGDGNPDFGMNTSFWPLFGHIKRRAIPMTSPVVMTYQGMVAPGAGGAAASSVKPDTEVNAWSMAFLYRVPAQGATGSDSADERVKIVDTPETKVVSVAQFGSYSMQRVRTGAQLLEQWFRDHPQWKPVGGAGGELRAFYYHGPDTPNRLRWSEVQIPIVPASPITPPAAPAPAAGAPASGQK